MYYTNESPESQSYSNCDVSTPGAGGWCNGLKQVSKLQKAYNTNLCCTIPYSVYTIYNMGELVQRLSILKIYAIIALSAFFFAYLLIPNPEPTQQIQGQYYGDYIWPVGLVMYKVFGDAGWSMFSNTMGLWFIYAFPVLLVGQGILRIPIPFSPSPYIAELPWPTIWQWGVLMFLVIFYNYLLVKVLPYGIRALVFLAKGAKYAQIGNPDEKNIDKKGRLVGQETEV